MVYNGIIEIVSPLALIAHSIQKIPRKTNQAWKSDEGERRERRGSARRWRNS